jgi:hypothetical protein
MSLSRSQSICTLWAERLWSARPMNGKYEI